MKLTVVNRHSAFHKMTRMLWPTAVFLAIVALANVRPCGGLHVLFGGDGSHIVSAYVELSSAGLFGLWDGLGPRAALRKRRPKLNCSMQLPNRAATGGTGAQRELLPAR